MKVMTDVICDMQVTNPKDVEEKINVFISSSVSQYSHLNNNLNKVIYLFSLPI
jgi:hypothetical protein